jgi:hypothetical protein
MATNLLNNKKNSVFTLFKLLNDENVDYIYRGNFDSKITDGILSLAEVNLENQVDSVKLKKRVYFILVEGLQNITRHQEHLEEFKDKNDGFLAIQKDDTEFSITTGNLIKNKSIEDLESKLQMINSLSSDELKDFYRKILDNETFSQKGGAGLGLIEIARKSGNKLLYDFSKVSAKYSYFYLQTKISFDNNEPNYAQKSLDNMKKIHEIFNKIDILLNVTGIFNHDKLIYIISILESHMSKRTVLKNKMFSLMIELMQNVVKHADEYTINNLKGKHSVFFITSNNYDVTINSGNYILNEKIPRLKKHLTKINLMSHNELNKFHFDTLVNYKTDKDITYGLGMLDMRIKSRHQLLYNFEKIDDQFSFFSLKVVLRQENPKTRVFEVEGSQSTPKITLDEKNGQFAFCGDSFPEDAHNFYQPIIDWISDYATNPRLFTLFEFKFRLLSTSSQKELINIFKVIEIIAKSSAVAVRWQFLKDNEDSFNFGLEFSKLFNIDFNLVEFDDLNC